MSDEPSAYCRGARAIQMIRDLAMPTTAEIAAKCELSRRGALEMLETLACEFPIYRDAGRWLWCGDERSWCVGDLVERIKGRHAALDALIEELRGM